MARRPPGIAGPAATYPRRWRSRPGGRGRASCAVEESPDSTGQGAGVTQAGVTSRRRNRKQTAPLGGARVKRCGKSAPAARATAPARQAPPGARPSRQRSRVARPSCRVGRTARVNRDAAARRGDPRARRERWPPPGPRSRHRIRLTGRFLHFLSGLRSLLRRSLLEPRSPSRLGAVPHQEEHCSYDHA